MNIEEQKKLEIEALEILVTLAAEQGIRYGELRFVVHEGEIADWTFSKHRKKVNLLEEDL